MVTEQQKCRPFSCYIGPDLKVLCLRNVALNYSHLEPNPRMSVSACQSAVRVRVRCGADPVPLPPGSGTPSSLGGSARPRPPGTSPPCRIKAPSRTDQTSAGTPLKPCSASGRNRVRKGSKLYSNALIICVLEIKRNGNKIKDSHLFFSESHVVQP